MTNSITYRIRIKKLGVLIKDARLASNKSIEDCARTIGISPNRIEAFEQGKHAPSLPELETLAYYLDVPLTHFWGQQSLSATRQKKGDISNLQRFVALRTKIVSVLLRKARLDSGLSLNELAKITDIQEQDIESYENGNTPIPLPQLESLARTLNLNIEFFFDTKGIIGEWTRQQKAIQDFEMLPSDLQSFVTKPVNIPYIEIAQRLSGMSVEQLRALAEGLLDITF